MTAPQTYWSWINLYLATKLTPAGTLLVTADPWVTQWRLFLKNNYQTEWIAFTSVSSSWSNYELWGLTRDIAPTDIPATSNSTGKTWLASQECIIVAMHDQLIDRNIATQSRQEALTFATTTARDTALWANGVCTFNYTDVKCTDTGLFYNYNTSTSQWEVQWTWSATPNASTAASWSVEIATTAESKAWTDTGGTWALLSVLPSDIAKNTQSWTFVYWHSTTWSDTYTVALTPVLTAYTTWMRVRVLFDTSNTWACSININSLWAKSIKLNDGTDPLDGDITATKTYELVYDGTNFVLQTIYDRASTSDATTGTNTTKVMSPSTTKDSIKDSFWVITTWLSFWTNYQASTSWIVTWYVRRSGVPSSAECYVWSANPATTLVWKSWSAAQDVYWFFSFPVKKWYYWRVDNTWSAATESSLTFTPNA